MSYIRGTVVDGFVRGTPSPPNSGALTSPATGIKAASSSRCRACATSLKTHRMSCVGLPTTSNCSTSCKPSRFLTYRRSLSGVRGESAYADLRTGLSPGEQSAAILTLALQTRTQPLILDQPEDELGYSYVVHLIVPKILQAKFGRQLLVVTHNANIPVLGDADYVTKMENRPHPDPARARQCVVAAEGCFESLNVTQSLIELEGGQQAFRFRQHRYALPRYGSN
jgi:hypothetical protein